MVISLQLKVIFKCSAFAM